MSSVACRRILLLAFAYLLLVTSALRAEVPLRVTCFNVENGLYGTNTASYADTLRILTRINADVVGLCEMMVTNGSAVVGDDLNFPALATELDLPYREFDNNPTPHRAGIASRYPIEETVWVNGSGMTRRIPLSRIGVPGTGQKLWVAMLHLKARQESDLDQHKRAAELYWLRQAILANCDVQNDSIVIMGDFNMVSPTDLVFTNAIYAGVAYPLNAPKDANGYFVPEQIFKLDARHAGPGGETYTWRGDNDFPPGALDHIMVNAPVRALGMASEIYNITNDAAGIDGLAKYGPRPPPTAAYGSDHLPIFADLQMADAPAAQFSVSGAEGFFPVKDTTGTFDAAQNVYTITNDKTTALDWFIHKTADWLDADTSMGTVSAGGSANVTISLNAQASALPPGDYHADILFTDRTTGSVVTRSIFLNVMGAAIELDGPTGPFETYFDSFYFYGRMSSALGSGLSWSNRANGMTGVTPYSTWWWAGIPLAEGTNVVDFRSAYATTNWSVLASDGPADPAYQSGWTNGSSGGQGFGAWQFQRDWGLAAYELRGTNVPNVPARFGAAFSLSAAGDKVSTARRGFERPMTTNDTLRLQFDNNWIDPGKSVGFALTDSNGAKRVDFYFVGWEFNYRVADGDGSRTTPLGYTDQGLDVSIELVGEDGYRLTTGTNVITGTLAPGGPISSLVASNNSAGWIQECDAYIGAMSIEDSTGVWAADSPTNPAYEGVWTNGSQAGFGFAPWQLGAPRTIGNAGHVVFGTDVWNVPPSFGGAFSLWAHGTGYSEARRPFPRAMATGDAFVLQFDNNWVEEGKLVGFSLADENGADRLSFLCYGGQTIYWVADAIDPRPTEIPLTTEGLELRIELTGADSYRLSAGSAVVEGTLAGGGPIAQLRAFNYGSGAGTAYDFYLGQMRLETISGTEHDVLATSFPVVRLPAGPAPSIEFTRGMSGSYTAGSSFYINANLGTNTAYAQLYINGASLGQSAYPPDNGLNSGTVSWRYTLPSTGIYAVMATANSPTGLVASSTNHTLSGVNMLEPLPVVSVLPFIANDTTPAAGSFVTLRAEAHFPSQEGIVEFYADGIYLGTAKKTAPGIYELRWLTPTHPINASITAQATVAYPGTGGSNPYFSAAISDNAVTLATAAPPADADLAAGRTRFEAVAKTLTWPEAYDDAIAAGGRLAVFRNGANYDKVISEVRRLYRDALWIGLTDQEEEGVWRWVDGTPLDFSRWSSGEPNDWDGNEDYAHVWWNWTAWNDIGGTMPGYLLEKAPVELTDLPVSSGGLPWFTWNFDAADGKDAAVAMTSDGEATWREYTFTGPAKVRFQWKVSSQAGDLFSYAVNGTTIKSISGDTEWTTETIDLPPGLHTIRWTYAKDGSGSAGTDAGFLDCLEFWALSNAPLGVRINEGAAQFGVWAPNATAVSVVGDFNEWTEAPLERDTETGYWTGTVAGATAGQEYQYLIRWPGNEDGLLKNDPRADWIRNGRSVLYDHAVFDWGAGFVPRAKSTGLVYELHIGTFNNPSPTTKTVATFDDAIQRLDYLQELGVEVIALMPVTEYETTTSWGYNPAYLFAVENDYGGPDGLKRFVRAAHARGMKVQLDIVHNHYIQGDYRNKGNYLADGPGLLDFDGPEDIYFYGRNDPQSGDPDQPKRAAFNWGPRPDFSQPEVRRYIEDNVRHWLEHYRIDGFRWDSPKNILGYDADGGTAEPDTLLPEAKAMMGGINRMIREQYPGRWSIAEEPDLLVAGTPASTGQFYLDAATTSPMETFDGHWQYAFYDSIRNRLAWNSGTVDQLLNRVMQTSEQPFTRVVFTDTHDLAGDLNTGLRVAHRVGESDPNSKLARKKTLLGAVLAMTAPGSPMLLMGQEFHATGAFSDRAPLDWSKAATNHRIFRAYRDLAALRGDFPSVRDTALSGSFGSAEWLGIGRYWRGNDVVVVFNASDQPVTDALCTFPAGGEWFVRINTDSTAYGEDFDNVGPEGGMINVTAANNRAPVSLAPYSAIVFTRTAPTPTTEDFIHGFKHVEEEHADAHLIETVNARKYSEWQNPPITYWGPSVNDADASVTYKYSRPTPILSGSLLINLASFNFDWGNPRGFGGSGIGSSSVWASKDGQNWIRVMDNPTPSDWVDSFRTFDGPLPADVLGGTNVWIQVRMRNSGAPLSSYATAQFARSSSATASNVYEVRLKNATDEHEDTDNDGLPDSWESITGATDPAADDDGDGLTNQREFLSGLDPKVFNPDAVVATFNGWDPTASPLTIAAGNPTQRGHMQFFRDASVGEFRWIIGGIFYGRDAQTDEPVADGPSFSYEAPAGNYVYFTAGENPATARAEVINPSSPLDSNSDLLDDRWQSYYGISDPNGDADGDSLPNLREFLRGSNPLQGRPPAVVGDTLPLAWTPDAGHLLMTWSEKSQRWEWIGLLPAGPLEFKFAMGPGWLGENHGRGNAPGTTDTKGTASNVAENIPFAGRHRFAFNELTRTYSLESFRLRDEWRETHNLPPNHPWTADSDGDGTNDLLEYTLGGDPLVNDAGLLAPTPQSAVPGPSTRATDNELIFSWIQNTDPDLSVTAQMTGDLRAPSWTDANIETHQDQSGVPAGHIRKFTLLPQATGRQFLRLRVELP